MLESVNAQSADFRFSDRAERSRGRRSPSVSAAAVRARASFSEHVCRSKLENTALAKLRLRPKPQTTFRRKRSVLESIAQL